MKPCLRTLFDQYVRRVHCKKRHNFTQRFDLQGHTRVHIFTYKDVSVCNVSPNFHMFYDNRRVSTQISRLSHVHAQVHTLKDMSSHTFCLPEMCPSTVWHLVSHYFVWCEGTINIMFTLQTLLGCVYVQLLTYEDVSVCISLTWSPHMHTNVQLKTRTYSCFLRLMSVSRTFPLLWPKRTFLHNFWHTRQRFWKIVCLDRRVCTQVLRLRGLWTNQNTVFCHLI